MSDFKHELARYLEQRLELGEHNVVMDRVFDVPRANVENASNVETVENSPSSEGVPDTQPRAPLSDKPKWLDGAPAIPGAGITIERPETHLFEADPLRDVDLAALGNLVRTCKRCSLCQSRRNAVPGEGPADAQLMVIGEGPGATEDETGRPFVGRAGQLLTDILSAIDCPRPTVFIGNIVKCRPPNNRDPEAAEIEQCLPYLNRQIELIHPSVILAMGRTAASTLLHTRNSLGSLRNKVHMYRGIPLIVTYHPAALLRNPHWKKPTWDDVRIARRILSGEH